MSFSDSTPPLLVEVGWEVCNRVGGIHTVLRTKVAEMVADWGDRCFGWSLGAPVRSSESEEEEPQKPFVQGSMH